MDKATIIAQPLELARLYVNGKGLLWNTLAEASRTLSKTEPKVTLAQLKHAKSLLSFPPQILSLFNEVGLNTYTRHRLVSARAKFGIENLLTKVATIAPAVDDEDRKRILKLLNDEGQREVRTLAAQSLVAEYQAGLVSKRWKNVHQASRQLGLRNQLYHAITILNLPKCVLELFETETLSLSVGRKLVRLVAMYGPDGIVKRATWAKGDDRNLPNSRKLAILCPTNPRDKLGIVVKARRMQKKLVVEFHCPDESGDLTANLDAFQLILHLSMATFLKERKSEHHKGIG